MSYLIDTDILIYSLKGHETVQKRFFANEKIPKSISVVSYGELLYGAKKSAHRDKNLAVVYRIKDLFPVIDVDKPVMETFSDLKVKMQKSGTVIDDMDLLIAATALTMNFILVSNNERHFRKIAGLKIENWTSES
jgi:tRNA(fMet)-specific endonuclease VapC